MNKYENHESIIEALHRARMEQWVGDFAEAEKIYETILQCDDNMVIYLKPSIENKKKKLMEDKRKYQRDKDYLVGKEELYYEQQVLFDFSTKDIQFGSHKSTLPLVKENKLLISNLKDTMWKYSVIVSSKANNIIRLEIRGYSQTKQKPNLRNLSEQISNLGISNLVFTPMEQQQPDSVCIDFQLGAEKQPYYIEIDSWGNISGETVVLIDELKVFFAEQIKLFLKLENILW